MADYLWHKISESERKKIEKDAKSLILEFGDSLEKLPELKEGFVERDSDSREEGDGVECDSGFRDLMFENAPDIEGDCILGERGSWT
tara:strand:- start:2038 stop:2298 length:261 start_codon:yes stop_codon:yes gene_type:complete